MRAATGHAVPGASPADRRMRTGVQIVGRLVAGVGLGAAVRLDPGLLFAGYVIGPGWLLLCPGLLLPADRPSPPHR